MKLIDLHVHSNISDGSLSPAQIVHLAKDKGLAALTLSDHESIAGNLVAAAEAAKVGIEFIPGMEMSVEYRGRQLHIVALGFDENHPEFQGLYKKIRTIKEARIDELMAGIRAQNIAISPALVAPFVVTGRIDRYAIMRYLVSLNMYDQVQMIWKNHINPFVVELGLNRNVTAEEALPAIQAAGGVTSLAHFHKQLGLKGLTRAEQDAAVGELHAWGLTGMEKYYPSYTEADKDFAKAMLAKYSLLPTGGTDFHGANRPGVEIGTGIKNNMAVPYSFYENIQRLCRRS